MRIKKFLPALIINMILASCVSAPTQVSNVTVTSKVAITSVPTTPLLPTETLMPTIDPNAPVEYSRFESGNYFLDKTTDKGSQLIYIWDVERKSWYREYFFTPLRDHPKEQNDKGGKDQLFMTVYIDDSIENEDLLPELIRVENTEALDANSWSRLFGNVLATQMVNAGIFPDKNYLDFRPWHDGSHKFHFDFKNEDGVQQWGLWEGSEVIVHIRGDYEQLKADMGTNGFSEVVSNHGYGPKNNYMVKIWTENGNLFTDISPSLVPATKWTKKQLMEMFMFGPSWVMEQATYATTPEDLANLPNLSNPQSGGMLSIFVVNIDRYTLFSAK